jgi:hypothetical protein
MCARLVKAIGGEDELGKLIAEALQKRAKVIKFAGIKSD